MPILRLCQRRKQIGDLFVSSLLRPLCKGLISEKRIQLPFDCGLKLFPCDLVLSFPLVWRIPKVLKPVAQPAVFPGKSDNMMFHI